MKFRRTEDKLNVLTVVFGIVYTVVIVLTFALLVSSCRRGCPYNCQEDVDVLFNESGGNDSDVNIFFTTPRANQILSGEYELSASLVVPEGYHTDVYDEFDVLLSGYDYPFADFVPLGLAVPASGISEYTFCILMTAGDEAPSDKYDGWLECLTFNFQSR